MFNVLFWHFQWFIRMMLSHVRPPVDFLRESLRTEAAFDFLLRIVDTLVFAQV